MEQTLISLVIPCFNGGHEALTAVEAVGRLPLPAGCALEAIVVDDASTDGSLSLLEAALPSWAIVVKSKHNRGRSGAINLGSEAAKGRYLLVLDADCTPGTDDFLISHLTTLADAADVSVGDVRGDPVGFWGHYQSVASQRRAEAARNGSVHALTTANMMLRATAFDKVNGFDTRYRHYGFEDRDFLQRLSHAGLRIRHTADATVKHAANLDMPGICRKMRESGRHSAALFRTSHPEAYRELGYAAIDSTLHPHRAVFLAPLARLALSRSDWIEKWLQRERWPYKLRSIVARAVTALAYLDGTRTMHPTPTQD